MPFLHYKVPEVTGIICIAFFSSVRTHGGPVLSLERVLLTTPWATDQASDGGYQK